MLTFTQLESENTTAHTQSDLSISTHVYSGGAILDL